MKLTGNSGKPEEALAEETNGGADGSNGNQALRRKLSAEKEQAEFLRRQVDTVGFVGAAGAKIHNVISVGMLSEGWDAKTVTHIMGLRAFTSQLLCEQVVGRGLRRTSYETDSKTGFFQPEYVNIFGVPFTFLPHEGTGRGTASLLRQLPKNQKSEALPDAQRHTKFFGPTSCASDHEYRRCPWTPHKTTPFLWPPRLQRRNARGTGPHARWQAP